MRLSSNRVNWVGFFTLYKKEVSRFLKVYNQTLLTPVVTALIFFSVFNLAIGTHVTHIEGVSFKLFVASGLIMMSVVQNAFANTSSTLVMGRVLGNEIDFIMPPFTAGELTAALVLGGLTRGFLVGICVIICMCFFVEFSTHHLGYILFHLIAASTLLALLGVFTGIVADSFDKMAAVTSYVITPLSFLSGTFYSVKDLPPSLYFISHLNPFFYMIDGFRYGVTGYHEGNLIAGLIILIASILFCWTGIYFAFKTGWRIKK